MDETPILNVVGVKVALGPLRRDLVPLYARWSNDFVVQRTYGNPLRPSTEEAAAAWYEGAAGGVDVWFTVYERATGRPVGIADLWQIERDHRIGWFGMMIGEADCRGKGYGTETTRLMLDVAFTATGLFTVMLQVDAFNQAGLRAYTRAGFVEVGRWRGATLLAGERHDRVLMAAHADGFASPVLRALLAP